MTGYEEFQRIMAELNRQIEEKESKKPDLPPGFEELFGGFKK
jgi:hypothetical protein